MDNDEVYYIRNKIKEHEERIFYLESLIKKEEIMTVKNLSIREFLISKAPNDDVKKTLSICYFLEMYEGMESLNKEDIEDGFRKAKAKVPENINYKVFRNIKKGYIMEAKNKKNNLKAWTLTNSGIEFVNDSFKKN